MSEPRKSKLWIKRVGLGVGTILILLLLLATAERLRGERALRNRLSDLRAHGEVLNVASLKPAPVPPDQNAFLVVATLTNRHDAILTNLFAGPPLLEFQEPGKAVVSWRLSEWKVDEKATNTWSRFAAQIEEGSELVTLIRSATTNRQYSSGFDYQKGFLDFQIGPLTTAKQGVQLLSAATMNDLRNGRMTSAHLNLCAAVRLALMQEPEPLIIFQLVRIACVNIALNATWQALQADGWTEEQLASIQALWQRANFPEDMAHAMEMERAMTLHDFEKFRRSDAPILSVLQQRETVNEFLGSEGNPLPTHGFVLRYIHVPVWRWAWSAQDQLRALNRWQTIIERERFARTNSWAALSSGIGPNEEIYFALFTADDSDKLNLYGRLRFLISNDAFSINDSLIRKELQMSTLQQLVVTAIAIQRYRLVSGIFPKNLMEIVPRYLPELPLDQMDGKSLRYRPALEDGFLLYSVGSDGKDNGGDASPVVDGKSYRQIWDGKDAVWPVAVKK